MLTQQNYVLSYFFYCAYVENLLLAFVKGGCNLVCTRQRMPIFITFIKNLQTMKNKLAVLTGIIVAVLLNMPQAKAQSAIPKEKYQQNKILEDQMGYTHAIKTGNTLYISGTTGTGTMKQQVASIMDDIQGTLQRYGATFKNVVRETVYTTNIDSFMAARSVRTPYYQGDFPTSTWVEVKRLFLPQFLVSIEITAVLPNEQ